MEATASAASSAMSVRVDGTSLMYREAAIYPGKRRWRGLARFLRQGLEGGIRGEEEEDDNVPHALARHSKLWQPNRSLHQATPIPFWSSCVFLSTTARTMRFVEVEMKDWGASGGNSIILVATLPLPHLVGILK